MRTKRRGAKWWRKGYGADVASRAVDPVRTQHLAKEVRGQWVALRNGEVIDAGPTFDAVMMRLYERDIVDVTVMRIPAEVEAELVGLG